jgi:hypothetical protein
MDPAPQYRDLTPGEVALAQSVYRAAIDLPAVRIYRKSWWPFQPRHIAMAPCGHLHFHAQSELWSEDFSQATLGLRGLFLHELCHVWQAQKRGRLYLPLMRHPFCSYSYTIRPGWRLERYGLEQQAEIVRHAYLLREGYPVPGAANLVQYESILSTFR